MTKKQLQTEINNFLALQDDQQKDEWYGTDKDFYEEALTHFMEYLKERKQ